MSMGEVGRSTPVTISFEERGQKWSYEISLSAPVTQLVSKSIDLPKQMERDGLSLQEITKGLRAWLQRNGDIRRVAVCYAGRQYSLAILLTELSEQRVADIYLKSQELCKGFEPFRPIVYVLGPNQQESPLLSASDCLVLCPRYA